MTENIIFVTILCCLGYLFLRILIELRIKLYCSKKEYKIYKREINFVQRYFVFWIKNNSRIKYLKSENRHINYPAIMSVYFYTHFANFISVIIILAIDILVALDVLATKCAEICTVVFLSEILLSFVVLALIENYEHRNYHKKRHHRKR